MHMGIVVVSNNRVHSICSLWGILLPVECEIYSVCRPFICPANTHPSDPLSWNWKPCSFCCSGLCDNNLFCSERSHQRVLRRRSNCLYAICGSIHPLFGQATAFCHTWEWNKWPQVLAICWDTSFYSFMVGHILFILWVVGWQRVMNYRGCGMILLWPNLSIILA